MYLFIFKFLEPLINISKLYINLKIDISKEKMLKTILLNYFFKEKGPIWNSKNIKLKA